MVVWMRRCRATHRRSQHARLVKKYTPFAMSSQLVTQSSVGHKSPQPVRSRWFRAVFFRLGGPAIRANYGIAAQGLSGVVVYPQWRRTALEWTSQRVPDISSLHGPCFVGVSPLLASTLLHVFGRPATKTTFPLSPLHTNLLTRIVPIRVSHLVSLVLRLSPRPSSCQLRSHNRWKHCVRLPSLFRIAKLANPE